MEKVLSIKQPWSSLIVEGFKNIENRTWKTQYRGKLLIHASAKYDFSFDALVHGVLREDLMNLIPADFIKRFKELPTSAIIGEVDLVDCVQDHPSVWADKIDDETIAYYKSLDWKIKPIWHWVLENPVMYEQPILNVKGQLNLWNYDK